MMDLDAVIIGAGPAGLFSALEIAKRGYNAHIVEEHEKIGEPDHCAGLLSTSGLKRLGVRVPDSIIQNTISGAKIYSPSGHSLHIERGQREAKVIDRRLLDKWLATRAKDSGVEISTKTKVVRLVREGDYYQRAVTKNPEHNELTSKVFVIAEGSRCQLSGSVGLPTLKRSNKYPAFQYEVSGVDINDEFVEMFYGQHVAPGFFAWIIPLGEKRARIGLAAKDKSKMRLDALIKHHRIISERMRGARIERSLGGIVLVGLPVNRMVEKNVMVVGDAAGIVKATTGGGVILGGLTARLAGQIAANTLSNHDDLKNLTQYDHQCKALVLRELRTMYLAQKILTSLSDKGLDSIVKDAAELGLLDIVKDEGDMDFQGSVIRRILVDPRIILLGLRAIRYINPFL